MIEKIFIFYGALLDILLSSIILIGLFVSTSIVTKILFLLSLIVLFIVFTIRKNRFFDLLNGGDDSKMSDEEDALYWVDIIITFISLNCYLILG